MVSLLFASLPAIAQTPGCIPGAANYPCLYVANENSDTVSVINATTNQVIVPPIGLGTSPTLPADVAVTPNNAFVYVADSYPRSPALSVIATATNQLLLQIPLKGSPSQVAITLDGKYVWAVETSTSQIEIVDTTTNAVVGSVTGFFAGGGQPQSVAFTPDGKSAYVAATCSGFDFQCAYTADPATTTQSVGSPIIVTTALPQPAASIAITPDGKFACLSLVTLPPSTLAVAFINTSTSAVSVVDTKTPVSPATVNILSDVGMAISPSGTLYLAAPSDGTNPLNSVYVFNATTQTFIGTITVGSAPTGVAISPGGQSVYVTNAGNNTVSVIQSGIVVATPVVGSLPQGVAVMPSILPVITTQPVGQLIAVGQTATLTVQAAGTQPLSYQWFQGLSGDTTTPISGANGSTFTTPALTVATSYWVQVANVAGSVNSNTATITVSPDVPTCTLLSLQGGGIPLAVMATATCTDPALQPLITTLDWGDGTPMATVSGGSLVASHTYSTAAPFNLELTATNSLGLVGHKYAFLNLQLAVQQPLAVFQGQTATVTIPLQSPPPTNESSVLVQFECTVVVDSAGNVSLASALGISCQSNPAQITLTNTPQPVTILINTTGAAIGALTPHGTLWAIFYACLMPVSGFVLLLGPAATSALRRPRWFRVLAFLSVIAMLVLFTSCGGGFTAPHIVQNATPPGNYRVTVVDVPVNQNDPAFVQTTLIVPLSVSPTQ